MRTRGSCDGKAAHQRRGRLRLPRNIDDKHDRQTEMRGEVGGGAAPCRRRGCVGRLEQTHDAFDDEHVGAVSRLRGERVEERFRHRPAIEIDARRAGHRGMERRIDVIGPGFCRAHHDAAALRARR